MIKEISSAVEVFHRIAFGTKNDTTKIPEPKLSAFVSALSDLLKARFEKNWYPENPDRASGYRCLRVNGQSIDPIVVESLKRAKIEISKNLIITKELTIWIDPGVVSVRIGEDGSVGSEVVDEEVYNIRNKKESAQKQSGTESDEGFSSRSSSPETSISDFSMSASSSATSSPIPSPPPAVQFSTSTPNARIPYPGVYQHPVTTLPSQHPQRTKSPTVSQFQQHDVRSQYRPMISYGPTVLPSASTDSFISSGYIPTSQAVHNASYTYQRAPINRLENIASGTSQDGVRKMAFNPYHAMSMVYGGSLQQANFYDIPAMA